MSGIDVERDERDVVTLWLSNPARLNALSNVMVAELCEAMARLADDAACRAVMLRGRGGVFCAGRDLVDLGALQTAPAEDVSRIYDLMEEMNLAIYGCPHPVVAVVERYALGIATMMVSWADIAIAEDTAVLGYPEVKHGITPYGAVPTMRNTMSQKAMMDLLLTGRKIDGNEAVRLGIVSRAVPSDRLEEEVESVIGGLLDVDAGALRRSKRFVRQCETLSYEQGIRAATDKAKLGTGGAATRGGIAQFLKGQQSD